MIINKFFIFCGLMFVLPVIYAAEFQIADTKIILPQIKGYKIGNKDVLQTITKVQTQATKIFAVYLTDLDIAAGDDWIGEKYIAFGAQKLWLRKFQIHHFQQMKQTIQTQFKTFEKQCRSQPWGLVSGPHLSLPSDFMQPYDFNYHPYAVNCHPSPVRPVT